MKKRILTISGIVALALLLAGAAFVGGRLLNGQGVEGIPALSSSGGDGKLVRTSLDDVQPAEGLPQAPADMSGMFDHRQEQSVFVGTGEMTTIVQSDGSPKRVPSGPVVEVVVTSQTNVYTDVTILQFDGPPPEGQQLQQVVEPGSLDEISEGSKVMVWGKKTGDRYIADVLVYTPAILRR